MATRLRTRLAALDGITLLDQGRVRSGLIAFDVAGWQADAVQRELARQGIALGCNGVAYTPLDMQARGLRQIARASVSYLTTEAEIDALLDALAALARRAP
ncbi:class V aminotransferase [Bordetella pertussis]|nr:class V aminotransferase [Bordetella pertussis]CFO47234.1 class V aminotransferase [Bordetella pertussis]